MSGPSGSGTPQPFRRRNEGALVLGEYGYLIGAGILSALVILGGLVYAFAGRER